MRRSCARFLPGRGTAALALPVIVLATLESPPVMAQAPAHAAAEGQTTATRSAPAHAPVSAVPAEYLDEVVAQWCVRCHNPRRMASAANLSLDGFLVSEATVRAETAEKMIRKLRADMMPPPGARRPGADTLLALVETLETTLDATARRVGGEPGTRSFQRLNRPEYEQAIFDLLGLRVDASNWLPNDPLSANFDNIADAQTLSATVLEAYLNAAADVSRLAIGDHDARAINVTYKNSQYVSQHPWDRVEGAPFGTRGGMVVDHTFPADGEYLFSLVFTSGANARMEDVDISVDGERIAFMHYTRRGGGADDRGFSPVTTEPVFVRAGQRRVAAAFIRKSEGPYEDLIRPHTWSLAGGGSGGAGITTLPHLQDLIIGGPYNTTGVSDTEVRAGIFSCRPTSPEDEELCGRTIITDLARGAYRRPLEPREIDGLMGFYREGEGFEEGVRLALEAILASPWFVFRLEAQPEGVEPGSVYELSGMDLASRLSFFLWGSPPDEQLRRDATSGALDDREGLLAVAARMLDDSRSSALAGRFAAQWLRLQDLYKVRPDPNFFPNFDENLADAMQTETELFFESLLREERSVLDLYRADFTFVNERLARHYGLPGVSGETFRRVRQVEDRPGLLGHGSVLVLTSLANRTSPVLRGKWVMEVLLGTPPPPPPPGVPDLDETEASHDGRLLTTRERMELHRASPACRSCHRMMDPIGLALDHFDVTGKWRVRENGIPLDTRGDFYDGTPVQTPSELAEVLLKRPLPLVRTFTENLMAYALGRRVEYYDQTALREIVQQAEASDYAITDLVMGVVGSDAFRMKRAPLASSTDQ